MQAGRTDLSSLQSARPDREAQRRLARSAGLLLRVLRMRAGLEQGAVGAQLGVSQSRISRWERGISLPASAHIQAWLLCCGLDNAVGEAVLGQLELAATDCAGADLGLRRILMQQLSGSAAEAAEQVPDSADQTGPPGGGRAGRPFFAGAAGDALAALTRAAPLSYDSSVPFYADVAAGLGEVQAPRYGPRAQIPVPAEVLRRDPQAYALRVRGDSMLPLLAEGDIVVVSPRAAISDGCIVAALVDPDGDVVKQYRRLSDGRVQLVPLNSSYPVITLRAAREAISALADRGLSVPPDALEREGQEGQLWGRVVLQLRDL